MRRSRRSGLIRCAAFCVLAFSSCAGGDGGRDEAGGVRVPADSVGYALRPSQVEAVVAAADSLEKAGWKGPGEAEAPRGSMAAVIVPHDDYIYAGHLFAGALRRIRTPLVVMLGVAHRARRIGLQGRLVFDDFESWKGPYGEMPVSGLRGELVRSLPEDIVLVDGALHAGEHSLEGMIPFLQYPGFDGDPPVEILPILVTRMPGESFARAADTLASLLGGLTGRRGMVLGKDWSMLISADCVHYGDSLWGGRDYAPFGTGREGYEEAVGQDLDIARSAICGTLDRSRIRLFRERVERDDLEWPYKVTWCGVYSIPFGMAVLERLASAEDRRAEGFLLGYGTSLDPGRLPLEGTGLDATNIAALRHWVGYLSAGFRLEPAP